MRRLPPARRLLAGPAAVAVLVGLLAGCGSSGHGSAGPTAIPSATTPSAPAGTADTATSTSTTSPATDSTVPAPTTGGTSSPGTPSPASLLTAALLRTLGERSARVSLTGRVVEGGQTVAVAGQGELRLQGAELATFALVSDVQDQRMSNTERIVGSTVYVQVPAGLIGPGKTWLTEPATGPAGTGTAGFTADPRRSLVLLAGGTGPVRPAGTAMIDGIETRAYTATVGIGSLAAGLPAAVAAEYRLETRGSSLHDVPVEVWVDPGGRIRQLHEQLELAATTTVELTVDLLGFGVSVQVARPPASSVGTLPAAAG